MPIEEDRRRWGDTEVGENMVLFGGEVALMSTLCPRV